MPNQKTKTIQRVNKVLKMKLIFVRHGQATAYCADDAGRNLTPFGQEQARQSAM